MNLKGGAVVKWRVRQWLDVTKFGKKEPLPATWGDEMAVVAGSSRVKGKKMGQ